MGTGAPFTYARLHDHVNIGTPSLGDPVDQLVKDVCDTIRAGLFALGIAEETESPESTDADFKAWAKMMAQAIKETYDEAADMRPMNLASNFLLKGLAGIAVLHGKDGKVRRSLGFGRVRSLGRKPCKQTV